MSRYWFAGTLALSFFITSCSLFSSSTDESDVVGEVDGEPVYFNEVQQAYQGTTTDEVSPELEEEADDADFIEFLDMYLDYRVKLAVARDSGILEDETLQSQLEDYQRQTAYPYWLERRVKEELLDELVERSGEEIHASHILIAVPDNASPSDTLEAYEELMEARGRYLEGDEDFEELSMEYSSRQQGRSMGGDLGYFSAGQMIKVFEDHAYNTPVDSVSKPFRSQFGYHVLKVKDRREAEAERHISHIFWQSQNQPIDQVMQEAEEAHNYLETGEDWDEVVARFSQDAQSRQQGGQIGWVSSSDFEDQFAEKLLSMEEHDTYTEPFQSEYGIHILRLDSIRSYESDEQLRDDLYERLQQLPRYRENQEAVLKTIRRDADEQIHRDTRSKIEEFVESTENTGISEIAWPSELNDQPLYEINNTSYTAADYFEWLSDNHPDEDYRYAMLEDFFDESAEKEVVPLTKQTFPEFSDISDQYLHGLAVFQVNEDSVWNYARQDTQAVKRYYEENQEKYQFPERFKYTRFSANSDSLLNIGLTYFEEGEHPDSIEAKIDGLVAITEEVRELDNEPLEHLQGQPEGYMTETFTWRSRPTVLYLHEILEPRQMTFEEAYNRAASDYQPIREKEWLQAMRERYNVKSYPDKLENLKAKRD